MGALVTFGCFASILWVKMKRGGYIFRIPSNLGSGGRFPEGGMLIRIYHHQGKLGNGMFSSARRLGVRKHPQIHRGVNWDTSITTPRICDGAAWSRNDQPLYEKLRNRPYSEPLSTSEADVLSWGLFDSRGAGYGRFP